MLDRERAQSTKVRPMVNTEKPTISRDNAKFIRTNGSLQVVVKDGPQWALALNDRVAELGGFMPGHIAQDVERCQ